MTEKAHNIIHIGMFVAFLIVFVLGMFKCCNSKPIEGGTETHSDTVYLTSTDTLYLPKDSIVYKKKLALDTIYIHDTILVREQKMYEDSLSKIWISGIEPEIDSIIHFIPRDTVIVTNDITVTKVEEVRSGWGIAIGLYAGYGGYVENNQVKLSPEIGIGGVIGYSYIFKSRKTKNKKSKI